MTQKFFNVESALNLRSIGPADSQEFVRFLDLYRDGGLAKSWDKFPKRWVWYGEHFERRPIPDMPSVIGAGLAFTPRAMETLSRNFFHEFAYQNRRKASAFRPGI